jgi:hypothetical protein
MSARYAGWPMRRAVAILVAAAALVSPAIARAAPCGLPDAQPLWIDFAHGSVQFRNDIFGRPGVVAATSGPAVSAALRTRGAHTVYWEMNLPNYAGRPETPADPATVSAGAARLFEAAVAASGCATPLIAVNELWGPTTPAPWTASVAQYRANVLAFLQQLSARGARPFLLVPSNPNTGGEAAEWWRQVGQVADVVRQVYVKGSVIHAQGPILGNREIRLRLRKAVLTLTEVGIPPTRIGLMLGLQSGGLYGRAGLQPLEAWLEVVKWNALAARQVATELGVATVWSWGWGTFGPASVDPDKPLAACVYLWTRDPRLCDAPTIAGGRLNTSLTDGQIALAAGVQCSIGTALLRTATIDDIARLTGQRDRAITALFARVVQRSRMRASAREVLSAERAIIRTRFRRSTAAYRGALARRGLTLASGRQLIADEVRRRKLAAALAAASPPTDVAAWTASEQTNALNQAICQRDELPAAGDVRLADHVPFLKVGSSPRV